MKFISHRGNLKSKNKKLENQPDYIKRALSLDYEVEVDVWFYKNCFFLGHDRPQYKINKKFLKQKGIWCHAKNLQALSELKKIKAIYFWHQNDDYTLTSNGFFWTYPGKKVCSKGISVLPEWKGEKYLKNKISGICSDRIFYYKKKFK